MEHHQDVEDGLTPPPLLESWSGPQREEALATLATLLASTIGDADMSSSEVRRALDGSETDEDWRSTLLEVEVGKLQCAQSRRSSVAADSAAVDVPTVPWRCPVCSSPQQVADARKLLRDRKGITDGQRSLPNAPTCKKCGFSAQTAA